MSELIMPTRKTATYTLTQGQLIGALRYLGVAVPDDAIVSCAGCTMPEVEVKVLQNAVVQRGKSVEVTCPGGPPKDDA